MAINWHLTTVFRYGWRLCFSQVGLYLFFGVCTTLVNLFCFLFFFRVCGWAAWVANGVAWGPAVLFAWVTNRRWVFAGAEGLSVWGLLAEFGAFAGSRLVTGLVDVALIGVTVDWLRWPEVWMKILVGVLIVLLNYGVSRWVVFRERREQ